MLFIYPRYKTHLVSSLSSGTECYQRCLITLAANMWTKLVDCSKYSSVLSPRMNFLKSKNLEIIPQLSHVLIQEILLTISLCVGAWRPALAQWVFFGFVVCCPLLAACHHALRWEAGLSNCCWCLRYSVMGLFSPHSCWRTAPDWVTTIWRERKGEEFSFILWYLQLHFSISFGVEKLLYEINWKDEIWDSEGVC